MTTLNPGMSDEIRDEEIGALTAAEADLVKGGFLGPLIQYIADHASEISWNLKYHGACHE